MEEKNKVGGAVLADGTISQTGYSQPVGGAITKSGIISQDGTTPITSESLRTATPLSVPKVDIPDASSSILGTASTIIDSSKAAQAEAKAIAEQNRKASEAKGAKDTSLNDLLGIQEDIVGVQANQANIDKEFKIDEKSQKLTDVTNQLEASQRAQTNELRALDGQGLTDVQKSQKSKEINRRYAFEQADLALIQSAANRDFLTAQTLADRKIQLQLEPLKTKLEFAKLFYQENKEAFNKEDDRAFKALNSKLEREVKSEEDRLKALENTRLEVIKSMSENGATPEQIKAVSGAKTIEDVFSIAGNNAVSPTLKLDLQLKKAQLAKMQRETELLGEPTAAEKKAQAAALKEAKASLPVMNDKIAAIDVLVDHSGMNTRVGTGIFSRKGMGFFGATGKFIATLPSLGLATAGDIKDSASGAGQDFAGGVHKLVGGLTLDNLIEAKKRGATFGALSEGELAILANSATTINDWEIKDSKGNGTGVWNIDEESFKRELKTIQDLTRRAILLSEGTILDDEEEGILNSAFSEDNMAVDPTNYY